MESSSNLYLEGEDEDDEEDDEDVGEEVTYEPEYDGLFFQFSRIAISDLP